MRILTVRQPWAWALVHGGKDVENRSRNLAGSYRGPVAIHAGKQEDKNAFSLSDSRAALDAAATRFGAGGLFSPWWGNHGRIIGVADLVSVHRSPECLEFRDGTYGYCSPWAEPDSMHLVFENPQSLWEPIAFKGAQGLRRLDEETTALVLEQIGGVS